MKRCLAGSLSILLALIGCREEIVHDASESDVNRIASRLSGAGIDAERNLQSSGRWSLSVSSSEALPAIRFLDDQRLIRRELIHEEPTTSLLSSREDQRFRYERSLSFAIEDTLRTMEGVLEARVHLNLPQVDTLLGKLPTDSVGSGSVLLVTSHDFASTADEIGSLVAGASGVHRDRISVIVKQSDLTVPRQVFLDATKSVGSSSSVVSTSVNLFESIKERIPLFLASLLIVLGVALLIRSRKGEELDAT